jgi:hypothetical protein
MRQAQTVILRLQELLTSNGIFVPPELMQVDSLMATIELVGRGPFGQSLHAQMPIFDHTAPAPHVRGSVSDPLKMSAALEAESSTALPSEAADTTMMFGTDAPPATSPPGSPHPHGLDSTQIGVNFVLALEQKCLYHHSIPSVPMLAHGDVGYGHSRMLSSPIMEHSPSYSLNPLKMGWPRGTTWNVPAGELERLLSFSDQIELEGEVTPVQVWNEVRCHPNFSLMTPEALEALRDALLPNVKCLGYVFLIVWFDNPC